MLKELLAGHRLFMRIPAVSSQVRRGRRLEVDVADVGMALEAIIVILRREALVNDPFHLAARTCERLQRMTATAGDVVVASQVRFKGRAKLWFAFFLLFSCCNASSCLMPDILDATVGLEQQQLDVIHRRCVTGVVRNVAVTAAGTNPDTVRVMWTLLLRRVHPGH